MFNQKACADDWKIWPAEYSYRPEALDGCRLTSKEAVFENRDYCSFEIPDLRAVFGGLEMHTHLLTNRLVERGHSVTLFAAEGSLGGIVQTVCSPTSCLERSPISEAVICSLEHDVYSDIMTQIRKGDFDLVHHNALHYIPLQESRLLPVPMIAVLHTPPFEPLKAAVHEAADRVTLVAVSPSLVQQWGDVSDRVSVIDNGIDLTRFPFVSTPEEPGFALWSGRIVPEKGLHLAIDAARLAGLPLRIAGPLIDAEYWQTHVEPRLGERTTYLGHLTQAEIAEVLGRASVLVCTPCWEEPFGLVVVEALACGTPVAGFARGALPDLLDNTCGLLVQADDVAALSHAILRCCTLDRRACRSRAEDLFDCDLMIDRYEALYERLSSTPSKAERLIDSELVGSADAV